MNKNKLLSGIVFVLILSSFVYANKSGFINIESIIIYLKSHPVIAPFAFVLTYAFLVTFFVPTLPMNLGAGFIWGIWMGGLISVIGATLGSITAFLVSRYFAHDYFNEKFSKGIWQRMRASIEKNNWKLVAITRINPAFPFGLTSYFFGLTPIKLKQFIYSTALFILPGAFIIAGIGNSIQGITFSKGESNIVQEITIGSILFTLLILLTFFAKRHFISSQKYNNLDLQ